MKDTKPLILVAPRYERCLPCPAPAEPQAPEETGASVFLDAIISAGGIPLVMALTNDEEIIDRYIALADGVAVPGGHDVNPALWGDKRPYDACLLCPERDAFELLLVRRALQADLPLFATCRGAQLLNVALGGTLNMDVPSLQPPQGMALWRHAAILHDPVHPIEVVEGSLLERCLGGVRVAQVNSNHHCCVDTLGKGVVLSARATDGVPEAIEVPERRFCLGVQWHPEYTWEKLETDARLWRAFVRACSGLCVEESRRCFSSGANVVE